MLEEPDTAARPSILRLLPGIVALAAGCAAGSAYSPAPTHAPDARAAMFTVTLVAAEFKWSPGAVTVGRGQRVRFRVRNGGTIDHTFAGESLRIARTVEIPPGGETILEWTAPPHAGSFEFWCDVPGHREAGMAGAIVVK